jgi:hypothetical protein
MSGRVVLVVARLVRLRFRRCLQAGTGHSAPLKLDGNLQRYRGKRGSRQRHLICRRGDSRSTERLFKTSHSKSPCSCRLVGFALDRSGSMESLATVAVQSDWETLGSHSNSGIHEDGTRTKKRRLTSNRNHANQRDSRARYVRRRCLHCTPQ